MYNKTIIEIEMRIKMKRSSGILMHISSLPGKYGIGDFGKEAYNFVDFLEDASQKNWQILPLGITSFGDSPYQSFSAFAGNPYFIDLDEFINKGYVSSEKIKNTELETSTREIDYEKLFENKYKILRQAYENSYKYEVNQLESFYQKEKFWLKPFSLFMALKSHHNFKSWMLWQDKYRKYKSEEVKEFEKNSKKEIFFWVFTQYHFYKQWNQLKKYANEKNIEIIGDLPMYVSEDSSDIWSNPDLFKLGKNLKPKKVSGVPPDDFSKTGQLWGNPIYDWKAMKDNRYKWWIERINHSFKVYDVLRIDHFRGFESYWEVDSDSINAVKGKWMKGPGIDLFNEVKNKLGYLNIIAEDLGYLTEEVNELIKETGYPGMKVLQFAFDGNSDNQYLPHNYGKNSIVYTGTHDNETTKSWYDNLDKNTRDYVNKYIKIKEDETPSWELIRAAWASTSNTAIVPMQDFLNYGNEARMNIPSTIGENWKWRIDKEDINEKLSQKISNLTRLYGR